MRPAPTPDAQRIVLPRLHGGQIAAHHALRPHRFKALRCGRRFGKTEYAKAWIAEGLLAGETCAWFAPQHMTSHEVLLDLSQMLAPLVTTSSRSPSLIRLRNGGRLDFWSLENAIAGRGRGYRRVVIDEAAFAKDGDVGAPDSMMAIWQKAIRPTLFDFGGQALVCSNSAGKDPDNFFYNICTEPRYGFHEHHATTLDNPLLPKRAPRETLEQWLARREQELDALRRDNDPLVYAQEYGAEFVDWSGAAFFSRDKLLHNNLPVPPPFSCDTVFAVIDTASKTGTDHDATAVTYFAYERTPAKRLCILDWDVVQIEGAMLEEWLPGVFNRIEELALACRARHRSLGGFIEDKNSGTILLQQALRRGLPARAIASKLTAMGKDERAISVSGYVHQGLVKYTAPAFDKVTVYKQKSRNHLLDQVESFRIGKNHTDREDDLLDTFCYGIALALGNHEGF